MHLSTEEPVASWMLEPFGEVGGDVPEYFSQGSHGQGKVSENEKKFKVREKSGNFDLSQGNLKFWKKSGKSQGIS